MFETPRICFFFKVQYAIKNKKSTYNLASFVYPDLVYK